MMRDHATIFTGFALAVLLTAIPFACVAGAWLSRDATLWLIGLCAIAQIAVHLHFFLGIGRRHRERAGSLAFTMVVAFIMVGGTIWVMANLNWRMGY
ncbi:cytochrome o ubiquinol oxidase subunit IV [Rhodobacteraceae bacterium F11138]|nr:cytochrome o ubiquinol oxidase subunit IV [Rhodobacteraceae bacterium F11138]